MSHQGWKTAWNFVDTPVKESSSLSFQEHRSKLFGCDTKWTGVIVGYTDGSSETIFGRNYCKLRDCDHPACMKYRISHAYSRILNYLNQYRRTACSHVTLTFGKNQDIGPGTLGEMKRLVKLFMRQIQYSGGGHYRAVVVYEMKRKPNGLYHRHCHIAFERSPHLNTVIKRWNDVTGNITRVDVKYNAGKKAMARYMARRLALGGVGVPIMAFLTSMKGRQLLNTFGIEKRTPAGVEVPRVGSNLVGTRNNKPKNHGKTIQYIAFLGVMPKLKGETIPPPLSEWGYS